MERGETQEFNTRKIVKPAKRPTALSFRSHLHLCLYRPLRGLFKFCHTGSWGFTALHPRLYAVARYRGLTTFRAFGLFLSSIEHDLPAD